MRKWIVIAVIFITVAVLIVVSGLVGNAVEYHKKGYVDALHERMWTEQLRKLWAAISRLPIDAQARCRRADKRMLSHERALIELGHFERRRFLVSSRHPAGVQITAINFWTAGHTNVTLRVRMTNACVVVAENGTGEIARVFPDFGSGQVRGSIVVVTRPEYMAKWAEYIHRAEMSQSDPGWEDTIKKTRLLYSTEP